MSRPLAVLASVFAAGCLAGPDLPLSAAVWLLALTGVLLAAVVARPAGRAASAALVAGALALGAAAAAVESREYESAGLFALVARPAAGRIPVRLVGHALRDAALGDERQRLTLALERVTVEGREQPMRGRARVDVLGAGPFARVIAGDRVTLWATLHAPRRFLDPGVFDAAAHARRAGVQAHGWCKSARLVEVAAPAERGLARRAAEARAWARARIEAHVPPGAERALVLAMLLGDRGALDDETDERFRAAGTYHVLALSGAQVALVAGLLWLLARRAGITPLPAALLLATAVTFYAAFVGGEVPVVRAAVMAAVLAGGRALELDRDLVNLLGAAALALLALHPGGVRDVGFQLSFGATWAVVALTPPLVARLPRLPLRLELGLASSLAAQVGLLPLLAAHFNRLAPAALLLNLAAVPLSSAVLGLGALVLPASLIGPEAARLAGEAAWIAAHALRRSADLMELAPWLDVRLPAPSALALVLYAGGVLGLLAGRRRVLSAALLVAGLLGVLGGPGAPADGRLHLTVLDVGQGDALVLTSPQGRTLLVDAGPVLGRHFDLGEAVVAPYLWWRGVTGVDALALSHAHPDHAGGVPFVVTALRVREVWEGLAAGRDPGYAAFDAALRAARVTRRALVAGRRLWWDGVELRVLGPHPPAHLPWRVRNDDSLVLAVRFGGVTLLLPGDVERLGEQALDLRAELLKVPHHGSRTSSGETFLARVAPQVAVVSAGRANPFGHPHPEVVARYRRRGVHLFRTDQDGAVSVATDGRRLWVTTFVEGRARRLR